jgi:hypothetical protein
VSVDASAAVVADLAVPSSSRLRAAICGAQVLADSGGVILGTVRRAEDASPAPSVLVKADWFEYGLSRTGLTRQAARRSATTTENGWFALCNVPLGGSVALTASNGSDSTGLIEVDIPRPGVVRRELFLGPAEVQVLVAGDAKAAAAGNARSTAVGPTTAANAASRSRRVFVGAGRLSGTVVSVAQNRPIAGAEVSIADGPQARTNDRGEWFMTNAPLGTRMVEVRAVGYYPRKQTVNVLQQMQKVDVSLSTLKAVLDTVKIIARRLPKGPDNGGFERRRKMGIGKFITPVDIYRFPVINTTDLFYRILGVRLDSPREPIMFRGTFEPWCRASIFVDGQNMSFMVGADIDDYVPPRDVAGIEIYTATNSPPQFQSGLGGCGSVVIWTK